MPDRSLLAAFLATSAAALGLDPAASRRMLRSAIEYPCRDIRKHRFSGPMARASRWLRKLGPYLALAALMPGGTVIALFVWLLRRKKGVTGSARPQSA